MATGYWWVFTANEGRERLAAGSEGEDPNVKHRQARPWDVRQ